MTNTHSRITKTVTKIKMKTKCKNNIIRKINKNYNSTKITLKH